MDKLPDIPGYKIKRMIGQGGMATVYLAEQVTLHRLVALKIMSPALAADDTFTSRFLKEGATSANLFHPKIIKVFDSGVHDHHYYMAMEYLNGGTLKDKIGSGLPPKTALQILADMADALRYAHSRDVVHRDIKSQNILMYEDGTPVLSDFGVAKALGSNTALTRTGIAIGSPGYMSPEQLRGESIDGRTDIYALGILFYEMLTGGLPYQATDQFAVAFKHIYDPIPILPPKYAVFQPILDKALAKSAADRVRTADALLELIAQTKEQYEASLSGETHVMGTLPSSAFPAPAPRRSVFKAALAVVVVAAIGIGAWFYYQTYRNALSEETEQLYSSAVQQRDAGDYQASLETIAKALRIDPNAQLLITLHRDVLSRLTEQQRNAERVAELLAKAQKAHEAGELQESLDLVRQGLTFNPESVELNSLQQTLHTAIQQHQEQLQALLREVEDLRQQKEYPRSLARLEDALALGLAEADRTRVQNLREQISNAQQSAQKAAELEQQLLAITAEARTLFEQENWQASLDKIKAGLVLSPQSSELIALQQQAEARLTEQSDRQEQEQRRQQELAELLQKAQDAQAKGELQASLNFIQQGLHINAEASELLSLRTTVQTAMQQGQRRLQALLDEAEQLRQQKAYTQSLAKLDDASVFNLSGQELSHLQSLQEQIRSEQKEAQKAAELEQQLQAITAEARTLFEQQNWRASLDKIKAGLALSPQSSELIALQQQAETRLVEQLDRQEQEQRKQQQLSDLLRNAQNALDRNELENSLAFIQQGLNIDVQASELLSLRATVQAAIQQRQAQFQALLEEADRLRQQKNYAQSLAKLQNASAFKPTGPQLSRLQDLRQQIQNEQQEAKVQQQLGEIKTQTLALREQGQLLQSLATLNEGLAIRADEPELSALHKQISSEYAQYEQALGNARQAQERDNLDESLQFIEQGLAIVPNSSELLSMRELMQAAIALRRNSIARLTEEAEQLWNDQNYPASLDKVEQALNWNPTESERAKLQALRQKITHQLSKNGQLADLFNRAQQALQNEQYEQSLDLIQQGLELAPEHPDFQRLQAETKEAQLAKIEQQQVTQQSTEEQQILELLALAERQIEDKLLTTPSGDNALETYQKVFAIDPTNQKAKQGLNTIADSYLALAQARKSQNSYRSSLIFIDRGLSIVDDHSGLLALRSEVSALQEQAQAAVDAARKERERQAALEAERREKERQAALEAERKQQTQQSEAERREKERQAALEAERKKQSEAARIERERQAALEAAAKQTPANNQQKASLSSQLKRLQNELADIQQQRSAKNCDYWERTYGLNDMSTRQRGCPRYNSQITELQQEISQVKSQLAALN